MAFSSLLEVKLEAVEADRILSSACADSRHTIMQEMPGHSTTGQKIGTYAHVLPDMDGAAAFAMDEALS